MSEYIIEIPDYVPPFDPCVRAGALGEEIVRCYDCKYFDNHPRIGAYCKRFSNSLYDDYDGFCAWGERRDA